LLEEVSKTKETPLRIHPARQGDSGCHSHILPEGGKKRSDRFMSGQYRYRRGIVSPVIDIEAIEALSVMNFSSTRHIGFGAWLSRKQPPRACSTKLKDQNNELWLSPVEHVGSSAMHAQRSNPIARQCGRLGSREATAYMRGESSVEPHENPLPRHKELPFPHQDPADRFFLAAYRRGTRLTLVTADHRLLGLGTIATWQNR